MTPMMLYGSFPSVTDLPTMSFAPPKTRFHNPKLRTATLAPPGLSSSSENVLPKNGLAPNRGK
jgi:hypothetical protein